MLNIIWPFLIIMSVICAMVTGRVPQLSNSIISGASDSISVVISFLGITSVWMGLMKIAEESKLTNLISNFFAPIINFLFKNCTPEASKAISLNITANFLGLGNAATPFGLKAILELQKTNPNPKIATNSMTMLAVINTVPLQLVPTMLCSIRQKYCSDNPMSVVPYIWISVIISFLFGITLTKILRGKGE